MSWEVCVGWMDGCRLMRVEIELALVTVPLRQVSQGRDLPLTNGAACGVRWTLCQFWANESKALRLLFFLQLQNMPLLCLTLHGLVARF